MANRKIVFVVQGEGRGHMTQAIALYNILLPHTDICEVIIGKSPQRQLPDFVRNKIKSPITQIESPNFSVDKMGRSINMFYSIVKNLLKFNTFIKSLQLVDQKIKEHNPDVIINFYEPLMGLYCMLYKPTCKVICIGHQYLFNHSEFEFPKGHFFDRISLKLYTSLTSYGSYKKLALSFYKFPNDVDNSIYVVPPLLREEVFQQKPTKGDYILVYLVNAGYLEDIISWQRNNQHVEVHCFCDRPHAAKVDIFNKTMVVHQLNDKLFLSMMANCKALVCSAGFESVSEALLLKKQVLMVPVENHFEQYLNSIDGVKAGAGIRSSKFKISKLTDYISSHRYNNDTYINWADTAKEKIFHHIS